MVTCHKFGNARPLRLVVSTFARLIVLDGGWFVRTHPVCVHSWDIEILTGADSKRLEAIRTSYLNPNHGVKGLMIVVLHHGLHG